MVKGLLYFAQNSAFQHLTKIGRTTHDEVEKRGLTASNVPEDFDYLAIFECDDIKWAEEQVHKHFSGFRHYSQTGRRTEFFWSGCVQKAIEFARDTLRLKDVTKNETEELKVIDESGDEKIKRVPRTTFEMLGLPVGTEILWKNDRNKTAIIKDGKNQIEYENKTSAISDAASRLLGYHVNGFLYFYYQGKRLFEMRPDQQDKED